MNQYKVYRTYKVKVEAENVIQAHAKADLIDLTGWELDGQEVDGPDEAILFMKRHAFKRSKKES